MFKIPSLRSILVIVAFFFASTGTGFVRAPEFTGLDSIIFARPIVNLGNTPYVARKASLQERHDKFWRFVFHNSRSALFTVIAGTVCFFFPAFSVSVFGFIIGVLAWHLGSAELFMRLMLPHSLTEIPTIWYYSAIAQSSGWKWLIAPRGNRWACFKTEMIFNLKLWAFVVLPLVFLNAFLEAYVTNRWW